MAKKRGGRREGAGRKPKYNGHTRAFSVTCPENLLDEIDADRGDMPRSEYTVRALRRYLHDRQRRQK
jgi:metal-responsive CopG/Arc/MetJ family transcriptional regulator